MKQRLFSCKKCGTIHIGVTRPRAEALIEDFRDCLGALPKERQKAYINDVWQGRPFDIKRLRECRQCGDKELTEVESGEPTAQAWFLIPRERRDGKEKPRANVNR